MTRSHKTLRLRKNSSNWRGFTVLELLLVCAILAVLLIIAVPGYQQYMMRGYRTTAIETLLASAACQERIYASEFFFDTQRCQLQDRSGNYLLRYEPADTAAAASFVIIADPQGRQRDDPCGSLQLDQTGSRSIGGATEISRKCWEGR